VSNTDKTYLAIDLGAESGRAIAGTFDGERLSLSEIHRFANVPIQEDDGTHWDMPTLFHEIKIGITKGAELFGGGLVSIGVDSWGVDYGLLDERGQLMGLPFQYRDKRTIGIHDNIVERLGKDFLYEQAGVQLMPMDTLYQLLAEPPERIADASSLLFIPDIINYWLTGVQVVERSFASTSQFYDPRKKDWAYSLLDALELPQHMLQDIQDAGTTIGPLLDHIADETGAHGVDVVLPGTHDTASAVAAVPAGEGTWAFLSSGTWSLLGIETLKPIMNEKARAFELGNEIGVCGTVRPLKNIPGMWLIQQCRAAWESEGSSYSYAELSDLASSSRPFVAIIDPDDPSFVPPGDMPSRIAAFCERTGQTAPVTEGEIVRTILESLAFRYRMVLEAIEDIAGYRTDTLHIVGGGGQNHLLNQFTANAIGRPVVVGPVEATATGNILMQMMAKGEIALLAEGREVVRRSFGLSTYEPIDAEDWNRQYSTFSSIIVSAKI
jgi:rhamnulokinase